MLIKPRLITKRVSIYMLKDPRTGKVRYIGKTICTLQKRLSEHINCKSQDHRGRWIQSLLKQNLKPLIEEIEKCTDSEWPEREKVWIAYYKKVSDLTNSSDGGFGSHNPSMETRNKISEALKGRKISAETIAKRKASRKGYKHSLETKIKLSKMNKGKSRVVSVETKAKMSIAQKGRIVSAEHRAKISAASKGRKRKSLSAETKTKISAAHKGKVVSAETRIKMSVAAKLRHIIK